MTRYGHCPRKPEGYKWQAFVSGHYFSTHWGFDTFAQALAYIRDQHSKAAFDANHPSHPGHMYALVDFRFRIDGPGGPMDVRSLVH